MSTMTTAQFMQAAALAAMQGYCSNSDGLKMTVLAADAWRQAEQLWEEAPQEWKDAMMQADDRWADEWACARRKLSDPTGMDEMAAAMSKVIG
jgi:hypothetical protein